jgi:glycosyltransferase involved in cell wall biosynthesis
VRANEYVLKEQLKAILLINPRPIGEDFTKYSFPSKNMEYMASGTPVLTTLLPGMPVEYHDHVFLIKSDNLLGIKEALIRVLSQDRLSLHKRGINAKKFVLTKKDNISQSKKILEWLDDDLELKYDDI